MGKPTGFMEYDRCEAASVEPKERIKNFNEFHVFLSKENQQKQAARCMDCGVPFCQSGMTIAGMTSGCPLHNLCLLCVKTLFFHLYNSHLHTVVIVRNNLLELRKILTEMIKEHVTLTNSEKGKEILDHFLKL